MNFFEKFALSSACFPVTWVRSHAEIVQRDSFTWFFRTGADIGVWLPEDQNKCPQHATFPRRTGKWPFWSQSLENCWFPCVAWDKSLAGGRPGLTDWCTVGPQCTANSHFQISPLTMSLSEEFTKPGRVVQWIFQFVGQYVCKTCQSLCKPLRRWREAMPFCTVPLYLAATCRLKRLSFSDVSGTVCNEMITYLIPKN